MRDRISSAAALPDGRLVVNTPDAPGGAFAIVRRDGSVERRFGGRKTALVGSLLSYYNSWNLTALANGEVVAAHAYMNLIRRYSAEGSLLWERPLKVPEAEELEARARQGAERISRGVDPCCVKAELVAFATAVFGGEEDRCLVRLGGSPILYDLDRNGAVVGRIGVAARGLTRGWETAGLAWVGERLVAVEKSGALVYGRARKDGSLAGRVVAEQGYPISKAAVSLSTLGGQTLRTTTGETGAFEIAGIPAGAAGELRAIADGYLETMVSGVLSELLARPIVLAKKPILCVVVRTADTREPVTEYRLSVLQSLHSMGKVGLSMGPEAKVAHPDGRACLSAPFAGPWLVRVKASGYATAEVRLAEAGEAEVSLAKEARLVVSVVDRQDRPVEGVQLFVEEASKEVQSAKAFTDDRVMKTNAQGGGTFEGLAAGDYRITASREAYLIASKGVTAREGSTPVEMTLSSGARVSVRVVTDESTPVPAAEVEVGVQGAATPRAPKCTTDDSGRCLAEGVPPGSATVVARGPDGATGRAVATIAEEEEGISVEVVLRRGVRVDGTVEGVEHWPEGALVVFASAVGVPVQEAVVSDRGGFVLNHVPSGRVAFFVHARATKTDLHFENVEIPRDRATFEILLRLPAPITLSGRVSRAGAGCGTCTVSATRLGADGGRPSVNAGASPEGRYFLRLPTRGRYQVDARDLGSNARHVETEDLEADREMDIDLDGAVLAGRVVLPSGRPAIGASVSITTESGTELIDGIADDLGQFRLSGLTPGARRVAARLRTATIARIVNIHSGETKVDLTLSDETTIRLSLRDSESGAPVLRAAVRVASATGEFTFQSEARADTGQEISVPAPGAGPWTVVVGAPGYAVRTVRQVVGGEAAVAVPLVLRYRAFTVEVTEEAGTPCSIQLLDGWGLPIALSVQDAPGPVPLSVRQAFFNQLEPGAYTAVLGLCSGRVLKAPLELVPGRTGFVRF